MKTIPINTLIGLMGVSLVIVGCGDEDAAAPSPVAVVDPLDEIRVDMEQAKIAAILMTEGSGQWRNPVFETGTAGEKMLFGSPRPKPDEVLLLSTTEGGHYFIFLARIGSTWKASITLHPDRTGSDFFGDSSEECLSKIRTEFGFKKEFSVIQSDCALP